MIAPIARYVRKLDGRVLGRISVMEAKKPGFTGHREQPEQGPWPSYRGRGDRVVKGIEPGAPVC